MFVFIFETDWDREWSGEGQRERETQNPKQAPGLRCQHRALRRVQTHELRDHDLSWSWVANQLRHPGALKTLHNFCWTHLLCWSLWEVENKWSLWPWLNTGGLSLWPQNSTKPCRKVPWAAAEASKQLRSPEFWLPGNVDKKPTKYGSMHMGRERRQGGEIHIVPWSRINSNIGMETRRTTGKEEGSFWLGGSRQQLHMCRHVSSQLADHRNHRHQHATHKAVRWDSSVFS